MQVGWLVRGAGCELVAPCRLRMIHHPIAHASGAPSGFRWAIVV